MKKLLIVLFSILFSVSLVLSSTYSNCETYGNCKTSTIVSTTSNNYSSINVNNSQYLQGYTPADFWQSYNSQTSLTGIKSGSYNLISTNKSTFGTSYQAVLGDDSNSRAGYFTNGGSRFVTLADASAGLFDDDDNNVNLCDGTYAIHTIGNSLFEGDIEVSNGYNFKGNGSELTNVCLSNGTGCLSYAQYQFIDNNFNGSGNFKTTGTGIFNQVNLTMDSNQRQAIVVDGELNDYTGEYTGNSVYVNEFLRAYNVGTKIPDNMAGLKSTLNIRHTNADISGVTPYYYALRFETNDVGNHINPSTITKYVNEYGMQGSVASSGKLDTNNTGGMLFQQFGTSGSVSDTRKLYDNGRLNPSSNLYSYGSYNSVVSNPVVYNGTWTINNYGNFISVTGNKNGSSTNYGIYIQQVTGADYNRGIYDISNTLWLKSGGDFLMRTDGSKFFLGQGDDSSISYNGTDMIINPKEVGTGKLFIKGNLSVDAGFTGTCINTTYRGGIAVSCND